MAVLVRNKKSGPTSSYERIVFNLGGAEKVRHEELEGRDHLVVPCVMITEGVHHGSQGRGYYSPRHTAKTTLAWNGMPIVVYHPKKKGQGISARQPKVFNSSKIGVVMNTRWSNKKLKTEAWIDYQRAKEVDSRILEAVENGKSVEVSTGLHVRRQKKKGVWNGEKYDWVAVKQQPDHLAVLPDQKGACSVQDGAGLLMNSEMSFTSISRLVSDALGSKYGEKGKSWQGWICDVFSDHVIYNVSGKMYAIDYKLTQSGVKLVGSPKSVERVIEYRTSDGETYDTVVDNSVKTKHPKRRGGIMQTGKRKRLVRRLIQNGGWTENDRDFLMKLHPRRLRAIAKKVEPPKAKTPVKNAATATADKPTPKVKKKVKDGKKVVVKNSKPRQMTEAEFLATMPPSMQAVFNQGRKALKSRKRELVKTILSNKANKFDKKWLLNEADIDLLEGMARLAANAAGKQKSDEDDEGSSMFADGWRSDYSGAVGSAPTNNRGHDDDEPEETLEIEDLFDAVDNEEDDDEPEVEKKKAKKKSKKVLA